MGHAESPSLISLGLAADVSQEGSSFRWGLATSGLLHALVIVMALFLRFQSTAEEPFRAIDVTLISIPEAKTSPPSQEKHSSPAPSPTKAQPRKETLPPLPTQTASERLSELLGGAVGSIVVPKKQDMPSPTPPPQITEQPPLKDQLPLFEDLRMPPAAPQISRPQRLQSSNPLPVPKTQPAPSPKNAPPTIAPPEPQEPIAELEPAKIKQTVRLAPVLPELSSVTPFKKSKTERRPNDASPSKNLEDSLKRTIPTIMAPPPTPKIQRQPLEEVQS